MLNNIRDLEKIIKEGHKIFYITWETWRTNPIVYKFYLYSSDLNDKLLANTNDEQIKEYIKEVLVSKGYEFDEEFELSTIFDI